MNQAPKVSVIVPVYNTEKYVKNCILSVLNQSYNNFELILVNDGSKDKSLDICKQFESQDSRVIIVEQSNQGVSIARMNGFLKSTGDYITFVDSDDLLTPNALEVLVNAHKIDDFDIIEGKYLTSPLQEIPEKIYQNNIQHYITSSQAKDYIQQLISGTCYLGPCCKLFKRVLFENGNVFKSKTKLTSFEDLVMNVRIALNAQKTATINNYIYVYYTRQNSVSHSSKIQPDYYKLVYDELEDAFVSKNQHFFFKEHEFSFRLMTLKFLMIDGIKFSAKNLYIKESLRILKSKSLNHKESFAVKCTKNILTQKLYQLLYRLAQYVNDLRH